MNKSHILYWTEKITFYEKFRYEIQHDSSLNYHYINTTTYDS